MSKRQRRAARTRRILKTWDLAEDIYPDRSTEFLMQFTCDLFRDQYPHWNPIDHGDVAAALHVREQGKKHHDA